MAVDLKPHVLMVPFPATGHINPLMQLAKYLASTGFVVTFANIQYNHRRILKFNKAQFCNERGLDIRLVGIPDGLSDGDNYNSDLPNLLKIAEDMGPALEDLIERLNQEGPPVAFVISDMCLNHTLDVAKKYGIPRVGFCPSAAAPFAALCHALDGIDKHTLPENGVPEPNEVMFIPGIPPLTGSKLPWVIGTKEASASLFLSGSRYLETLQESEWVLWNTVYEFEAQALEPLSQGFRGPVCPIGPLLPSDFMERKCSRENRITASLWLEEDECLEWLDSQANASVLYVSLGSFATIDKQQFEELAYGLEASQQPLLWVIRPDITRETVAALPEGLEKRTAKRVKIVSWAPQLLVLSHSAIRGFLTHCGWNSTMESMSMAVPMLAWPQLADQHINAKLVVDKWRIALALDVEEKGFVGRATVEQQVKRLMGDSDEGKALSAASARMREMIVRVRGEGGSSYNNLEGFVNWAKQQTRAHPQKHNP